VSSLSCQFVAVHELTAPLEIHSTLWITGVLPSKSVLTFLPNLNGARSICELYRMPNGQEVAGLGSLRLVAKVLLYQPQVLLHFLHRSQRQKSWRTISNTRSMLEWRSEFGDDLWRARGPPQGGKKPADRRPRLGARRHWSPKFRGHIPAPMKRAHPRDRQVRDGETLHSPSPIHAHPPGWSDPPLPSQAAQIGTCQVHVGATTSIVGGDLLTLTFNLLRQLHCRLHLLIPASLFMLR
jgi:hypothetical protein